ncbi:NAD(P)H-dependent oxidoreductase [Ancylobacter dichloromethanicus]|uniref:NAD(P)H dehydrogenase (Quinone) n=1 Tax=Ancylobacter dichloromethanicus TaxID=518825 RepID=A0A9W6J4R1_9HYPH|nr:NAD(P)H-dependent oxidoreductase [Ancylobacter dichloromethanicus]MBS7555502.1 NAD(P)H-dependent oxidoreductase [Ancylobacter dichloromethanicus]GLK70697.1 NAD(P)H dehydrogenase (quinone) [Ancylobacter dichloromethanicus]
MRALVVYCHPVAESFTAGVRDAVLRGLRAAGHEVDLIDLHAEGFDPVMGRDERLGYHEPGINVLPVAGYLERVKRAEALIFVAPTWWYGPPAMLKGWLDRVLVPHETFGMPQPNRPLERRLTNIRVLAAVTSLGSPWYWWLWIGQPGRRILLDGIGGIIHPRAKKLWLALHSMDSASASSRATFLSRVEARFSRL